MWGLLYILLRKILFELLHDAVKTVIASITHCYSNHVISLGFVAQ